jgi:hypothetical protein
MPTAHASVKTKYRRQGCQIASYRNYNKQALPHFFNKVQETGVPRNFNKQALPHFFNVTKCLYGTPLLLHAERGEQPPAPIQTAPSQKEFIRNIVTSKCSKNWSNTILIVITVPNKMTRKPQDMKLQ